MGRSGGIQKRKITSSSKTVARSEISTNRLEDAFNENIDQVGDQVVGFFERFNLPKKRRFKLRLNKIKTLSKGSISEKMQAESLIKDSIEELAQVDIENEEARAAVESFLKPYKEAALKTLQDKTDQDLSHLSDGEIIRLARWQEGIDTLLKEDTLNSKSAYALLTEANGDGNWLEDRLEDETILKNSDDPAEKERIHLQIKIIEGVLAVEADLELKEIDDTLRNNEDLVRDQATLLGERPDRNIVILPTPDSIGVPPRDAAPAHHCYSSGRKYGQTNKYIFLYADSIIESSGDRENGSSFAKEDTISFARHELIHAGQVNIFGADRKYRQAAKAAGLTKAREQEEVATQIKEALTEGLTITRGFEKDDQVFNRDGIINSACSYREEMFALVGVFDRIGIEGEKRESVLEILNTMPAGDVVEMLDSQLKKTQVDEDFISLFQRLLF